MYNKKHRRDRKKKPMINPTRKRKKEIINISFDISSLYTVKTKQKPKEENYGKTYNNIIKMSIHTGVQGVVRFKLVPLRLQS